jgi:3-oxosteroid 1-dehydrogenase
MGWLHRAATLDDLAGQLGIDASTLSGTVTRFNTIAASGDDTDFGRGKTLNDRYYADPRAVPNPSLGPIEKAPFYAVPVVPGDLGTKFGLVTDDDGRVLDEARAPIPVLYAAGNTSSSVMGPAYPGAGGTLAPAMAFAFLAAEAAAGESPKRTPT